MHEVTFNVDVGFECKTKDGKIIKESSNFGSSPEHKARDRIVFPKPAYGKFDSTSSPI